MGSLRQLHALLAYFIQRGNQLIWKKKIIIPYLHFLQLVRDPVMSQRPPVLHLNVVKLFSPLTYRLKKALQLKQQTAP